MIEEQQFEELLPLALAWARAEEEFILSRGSVLSDRATADAVRVGVRNASRVRVLVVDKIPLPEDERLAEASRRAHIITDACRGVAIGHGVMIRASAWTDRELLVHQLVHVAQCERSGGLPTFVREYLADRTSCASFTVGTLEDEARRVASEVCAAAN